MPKTRVFADTNVILEAFRTGCWTAISSHFAIETVQKCVEETLTGNPSDPRHIAMRHSLFCFLVCVHEGLQNLHFLIGIHNCLPKIFAVITA